jgi:acyl carrier protein
MRNGAAIVTSQKEPPGMTATEGNEIVDRLIDFVLSSYPTEYSIETLPRDDSLVELGVLDSAGVIEMILFMETTWRIHIPDEDITRERMGSLNKMAALVREYVTRAA